LFFVLKSTWALHTSAQLIYFDQSQPFAVSETTPSLL